MRVVLISLIASLGACSQDATASTSTATSAPATASAPARPAQAPAAEHHAGAGDDRAPVRTLDDGTRVFGREMTLTDAPTPLASLTGDPRSFADRVVKTEGEIARVCQRMGCWMEIRESAGAAPVRVPMAGHAFFLPQDVTGRRATVEGRVSVRPLSEGMKQHLREEGAEATELALSIEATSVYVR